MSLTHVPVVGAFVLRDDVATPAAGKTIHFIPITKAKLDGVVVTLPSKIIVVLDANGEIPDDFTLPTVGDGVFYKVIYKFSALPPVIIEVLTTTPVVDLATYPVAVPTEAMTTYLRLQDLGNTVASQDQVDDQEVRITAVEAGGAGVSLSNAAPLDLGAASAGTGLAASRDDHTHKIPTKNDLDLGSVNNTADTEKPVSSPQATAIATAKSEAISTAAGDATGKANTAQSNAINAAALDATAKANAAAAAAQAAAIAASEPQQTAVSQVEAEAGVSTTTRSWTVQRVWQAIAKYVTTTTWINGLTAKTTPVNADSLIINDSATSNVPKKLTFTSLKTMLFGSPALTGVPTTPTAALGNNTTQVASTAFVIVNAGTGGSSTQLQFNNSGVFGGAAGATWASNQLLITAQAAGTTPFSIKGATSQTAPLTTFQSSVGTVGSKARADGQLSAGIVSGAGRIFLDDVSDPAAPCYIQGYGSGYGLSFHTRLSASPVLSFEPGLMVMQSGQGILFGDVYNPVQGRALLSTTPLAQSLNASPAAIAAYPFIRQGTWGGPFDNAYNAASRSACDIIDWLGHGEASPVSGQNGGNAGRMRTFLNKGGTASGGGTAGADGEFEISQWDNTTKEALKKLFRLYYSGEIFIANTTEPATPTAGVVFWAEGGAYKCKGSSGTVTTIGAA